MITPIRRAELTLLAAISQEYDGVCPVKIELKTHPVFAWKQLCPFLGRRGRTYSQSPTSTTQRPQQQYSKRFDTQSTFFSTRTKTMLNVGDRVVRPGLRLKMEDDRYGVIQSVYFGSPTHNGVKEEFVCVEWEDNHVIEGGYLRKGILQVVTLAPTSAT